MSSTWPLTSGSLSLSEIRLNALRAVVWSLPPRALPISGYDELVWRRHRYIETCLGYAMFRVRLFDLRSATLASKYAATVFTICSQVSARPLSLITSFKTSLASWIVLVCVPDLVSLLYSFVVVAVYHYMRLSYEFR